MSVYEWLATVEHIPRGYIVSYFLGNLVGVFLLQWRIAKLMRDR